jgi:hypothetical protein
MNRAPVQYFDPRTGRLLRPPNNTQGYALGPAPMRPRTRRGFGDVPASTGAAGPLIPLYDEAAVYNPPGINSGSASGSVAASTANTANPSTTGYLPASGPYGESDRPWSNPTTFATVPINASTNTQVPVLTQNYQRNALIIQNGSLATSPDVAPTLYVNFNAQPQVGSALALPPGVGVAFDIITPRDSIYIAFGPFINTGSSVMIQGAVIAGTYSP